MKTLVLIPCYNEEENIERVISRLKTTCPDVDYLIINDCSTDNSEEILRKNKFNHVTLSVNLGIGGGIQTGYRYAKENGYDVTVQMDGDGQHNPEYLNIVTAPIKSGELDMCVGSRFLENKGFQSSALRRFGINLLSFIIKIFTGKKVYDVTSGFRATGKEMTAYFADHYAADYPEPEAILAAVLSGFNVGERAVIMEERLGGTSSIHSFKSAYYMIKVSLALVINAMSVKRKKKGGK